MRRAARSRTAEFGSLYKGREGQWSWIAHRVTGVAIILFLFAHVVDTALVGWGPNAYNRVVSVYHNPFIRLLELGLVAAVIYHALNGIRIMIIDFWPKTNDYNRQLIYTTVGLFVLSMIPISAIIVTPIVEKYFFTFPSWWPF
jgi:succinate dehydrogenase / fumarate reductase cytochrome b subunit